MGHSKCLVRMLYVRFMLMYWVHQFFDNYSEIIFITIQRLSMKDLFLNLHCKSQKWLLMLISLFIIMGHAPQSLHVSYNSFKWFTSNMTTTMVDWKPDRFQFSTRTSSFSSWVEPWLECSIELGPCAKPVLSFMKCWCALVPGRNE